MLVFFFDHRELPYWATTILVSMGQGGGHGMRRNGMAEGLTAILCSRAPRL